MNIQDEQFVVYLFSLFYRELGFQHIVQMQLRFPDCTAVKEGKQVSIEFQRESDSLSEHLLPEPPIYRNLLGYDVSETDKEIIVKQGSNIRTYPKSDYKLYVARESYEIRTKVLKLDYCVCWKVNHNPSDFREEYSQIKEFIELSRKPIIIDFMEKRKQSLEMLGIKDLATEEK